MQPNYKKLDPELKAKIEAWEKENPTNKILKNTEDIADIIQGVYDVIDDHKDDTLDVAKQLGATLLDIREKLMAIGDVEAPEMPDYAKPVVSALDKLEKALASSIKGIDVKPSVKVDAPQVNVDAPDFTKLEKILKTDIPNAFKDSIKLIPESPKVSFKPLEEVIVSMSDMISEKLESIDIASRMKPQFPSQMKVTNPDGSAITGGFSPTASITTTITPTVITQTDGTLTYTATFVGSTITESWS